MQCNKVQCNKMQCNAMPARPSTPPHQLGRIWLCCAVPTKSAKTANKQAQKITGKQLHEVKGPQRSRATAPRGFAGGWGQQHLPLIMAIIAQQRWDCCIHI